MIVKLNFVTSRNDELIGGIMLNPRVAVITGEEQDPTKIKESDLRVMLTIGLLICRLDIIF